MPPPEPGAHKAPGGAQGCQGSNGALLLSARLTEKRRLIHERFTYMREHQQERKSYRKCTQYSHLICKGMHFCIIIVVFDASRTRHNSCVCSLPPSRGRGLTRNCAFRQQLRFLLVLHRDWNSIPIMFNTL